MEALRRIKAAIDAWSPMFEEESHSDRAGRLGELQVAQLFQGVSGVMVFQSLRIPDAVQKGRREIDLVLLTKKKLYVVEVKNWSGTITLQPNGRWCQIKRDGSQQILSDVVEDTRYRAELLESYIERRGVSFPSDFIEYKIFLVNPNCRPEQAILDRREVLTSEQWQTFLDDELERGRFGWFGLLPGLKKDTNVEAMHEQLSYILHTAPTWDKLYLEGGRIVVGDFLHFKARPEDMQALRGVKRSKVSHIEMTHVRSFLWNILGLLTGACPEVKLECTSRDVRQVGGFPKRKQKREGDLEVTVKPDVEVVFRPVGSNRPQSFKMNNITNLTLSV